jgi:hypothetical protein
MVVLFERFFKKKIKLLSSHRSEAENIETIAAVQTAV